MALDFFRLHPYCSLAWYETWYENGPDRQAHEGDRSNPVDIGISEDFRLEDVHFQNDRIIYAWLTYAGRYDVKTIDRHLAAIRYCEDILAGKPFSKLNSDDVAKVRDDLKRRAHTKSPDSLSASSIRHRVSHLSAFFDWLRMQDGFKSMPEDLSR